MLRIGAGRRRERGRFLFLSCASGATTRREERRKDRLARLTVPREPCLVCHTPLSGKGAEQTACCVSPPLLSPAGRQRREEAAKQGPYPSPPCCAATGRGTNVDEQANSSIVLGRDAGNVARVSLPSRARSCKQGPSPREEAKPSPLRGRGGPSNRPSQGRYNHATPRDHGRDPGTQA